jgi:DNA polymerase III delta prime subunit
MEFLNIGDNQMQNVNNEEFLWVEKYRPQTIDDCLLPEVNKQQLKAIAGSGRITNLLLTGGPGTGKTTAAKALCNELGCDWLFINASEDGGIDTLRTKIRHYASTTSLTGNGKVVIMDEADHLTGSAQAAFRSALEEFSKNCSFIMTCNFPNRLIEPLRSRLKQIEFSIPMEERPGLAAQLLKRVMFILDNEKVEYDKRVVAQVVQRYFPDNRKVINELNGYAAGGKTIDIGILQSLKGSDVDELVRRMKGKDFKAVRQWAADTAGSDTSSVYEGLYKVLYSMVSPSSIPEVILTIEDYQRYDGVVPSKEVHIAALAVSLMASIEWA